MQRAELLRERKSHIWRREEHEHYVEPEWVSRRLFEEERFSGSIYDPACGFGTIVRSAVAAGYKATGSDIVDRGGGFVLDFFRRQDAVDNIVSNPPFDVAKDFCKQALRLARLKVAFIFPTSRLNAARWLMMMPLCRVWLLTPRPSMPPGDVIARGEKPGGGKTDYCWLVFEQQYCGQVTMQWLGRDAAR